MNPAALTPAWFNQGSSKSGRNGNKEPAVADSIARNAVLPFLQSAVLMQNMIACAYPLEKVMFAFLSSKAALRQHKRGSMPTDSRSGGKPAGGANQSKKRC